MSILVIDVGTSNVRAAVVDEAGRVVAERRQATPPDSPMAGLVEFDAAELADTALGLAHEVLAEHGAVDAVGVTNQRASTIVWDRSTGVPVAPALGWQDLRTVGDCLVLAAEGFRLAPNQSATKLAHLLDTVDPERSRDLCFGTVDSWLIWRLTGGAVHVTDLSNAAVTGLFLPDGSATVPGLLERLRIDPAVLPRIVDSSGIVTEAVALPGAPPVAGIAGDQQASLIGQSCVRPGRAKATFGTGGMLDVCIGERAPERAARGAAGTFPIVCWRRGDELMWGAEGIMLSAGTNVEWLVEDLGIAPSPEATSDIAASVPDSAGAMYVPALLGLGTPHWDYGARGTLLGITRGTTAAHIVRAVLEGVAHRGADLLEATAVDSGIRPDVLRVDGGMSANPVFVQALADACGVPVEVSREAEATSLGAAYLAGLAVGTWSGWDEIESLWKPAAITEPAHRPDRERWHEAVARSRRWHEDLSSLDF